ncbi:mixed lineage kinase domain-like protein [Antedon mediterranea]|uniref:mixed lineage kinase domain-like protein n=1 Tax=Antedon mediterranea TaxID=105859 RepID=UPI003AF55113
MTLEIISAVFSVAEKCYDIAHEVKSFKTAAKHLADRIKLLLQPIDMVKEDDSMLKEAEVSGNYQRFLEALKQLEKHITEIMKFLQTLKKTSLIQKVYKKGDITDKFNDFNEILDGLVPGLSLILQLEQRKEYIDQMSRFEDGQQAVKNDIANLAKDIKEMFETMQEYHKNLPGKSRVPQTLQEIKMNDFDGMTPSDVQGTFGKLFLASYKPFDEKVAIKKLPDGDDKVRTSLKEEASKLKTFESPYIVKLWGICIEGDKNMLVFEYMEKGTLRKVLDDQHAELSFTDKLRMALDGALGLYRIHHLQELHRVITSSKFLVNKHFKVKLSDVGLSRTWESASKSLPTKAKPKMYYAPELLENFKAKFDIKCEIYCFGIVLWEIFTGLQPYKDGTEMPRETFEIPDELAKTTGDLISRCLRSEAILRPHISEIVDELRKMLDENLKKNCQLE